MMRLNVVFLIWNNKNGATKILVAPNFLRIRISLLASNDLWLCPKNPQSFEKA